jgi:hypothetical protein
LWPWAQHRERKPVPFHSELNVSNTNWNFILCRWSSSFQMRCDSAFLAGLDVSLLLIQTYCCIAKSTIL